MALLKAFVCQVILFGLYKLFLEQVVEEHLVPDELTRNCLVGFVGLLCFGIQLYTDKAGDENDAETDENQEAKSDSKGNKRGKMSEPSTHETIGSNASYRVSPIKLQTSWRDNAAEPNDKQDGDTKERSKATPSVEAERVAEIGHSGVFAQFSPYICDTIPNIKEDGIGKPEVPASNTQTLYDQETMTIPVSYGFPNTNGCEESDEDGIEIDQFVAKESDQCEVERLRTVQAESLEAIKTETLVESSEYMTINENNFSTTKDANMTTTTSIIGQPLEAEIKNGTSENSLNKNLSSTVNIEIQSKKSVEDEVRNGKEMSLFSELDEYAKYIVDSLPSAQEIRNTSSSTQAANAETIDKNNAEKSTLIETVSSPIEKSTVSTARQYATVTTDMGFMPVTVDISFIYACH